nr:hypothetical protein [Uronema sp. CCAP 334/1]
MHLNKQKMVRQFRINLLFFYVRNLMQLSLNFSRFFATEAKLQDSSQSNQFSSTETGFVESSQNFFSGIYPGIYEIVCKVNNKRYIGEAGNVLDRLAKHSRNLLVGQSECTALQKDWNLYGAEQFEAHIVCCGPAWSEKNKRLAKEKEIICRYKPEEVYNQHPQSLPEKGENFRYVCEINGVQYDSVYQAHKKTGEKESTISNKLKNGVKGYVIIEKVRHGYEPIIADGIEYESITAALNDGRAKVRYEAYRFLKSKKKKDWNYLSPKKRIDK